MWLTRQDGIDIHLLENRALVLQLLSRNGFELLRQFGGRLTSMGLDHSNDHVLAPAMAADGFTQHAESLANARGVAQEKLEHTALLRGISLFQPLLRSFGHRGYCRR